MCTPRPTELRRLEIIGGPTENLEALCKEFPQKPSFSSLTDPVVVLVTRTRRVRPSRLRLLPSESVSGGALLLRDAERESTIEPVSDGREKRRILGSRCGIAWVTSHHCQSLRSLQIMCQSHRLLKALCIHITCTLAFPLW